MIFKKGAKINGMKPEMVLGVMVIETVLETYGLSRYDFVITSGTDGKHKKRSKHRTGYAVDVRIWAKILWLDVCEDLRKTLTDEFDVVLESDHIHVEFDPE